MRGAARAFFRPRSALEAIALSVPRNDLTIRQQLEPQRAGDRYSFYQTDVDDVPQPVHGTAARADESMPRLVIIEIFRTQRTDRHQPVGAGIVELDEQAGAGDAGNPALEGGADAIGKVMRDQAIGRL